MSRMKQVKVDNWGVYFLQRLKHFFNRTDYCDLTLQFQDNAQLKVHRLVLSACTEYFELLERTCEMYEDCLVMPEDLQADVVVPIVNFMYTGQLEFENSLLENLYQTSQIMNMPVLTKLLEAHRNQPEPPIAIHSYSSVKRSYSKSMDSSKSQSSSSSAASLTNKRSFTKAFGKQTPISHDEKRPHISNKKPEILSNPSPLFTAPKAIQRPPVKKYSHVSVARPTRYELPEELDVDNIFDNSFSNISYNTGPLMVHPETSKKFSTKTSSIFGPSKTSTVDIVECKKISRDIFDDVSEDIQEDTAYSLPVNIRKDASQLFDQIVDHEEDPLAITPKVSIETKDSKHVGNIDHAKIISEVLKKYPHLVKSNKNIKLKILNSPSTINKPQKKQIIRNLNNESTVKQEPVEYTYESDVIDSKDAARLIALGADNVTGPWICLICGTPGKALHFTSYYNFRRHLVEVHKEKQVSKMCEYCGAKYLKRNYLLHHLYTKHGVEPPPTYHFPKCNMCSYIALNDGFLLKHKMNHAKDRHFKCIVCNASFNTTSKLMEHMQRTGHKYSGDKKGNLQCVYCMKSFHRENNLYAHIMTNHKVEAKNDGIVEESDEEKEVPYIDIEIPSIKHEHHEPVESKYQIKAKSEGNIQIISKKSQPAKQKILNTGYHVVKSQTQTQTPHDSETTFDMDPDEIVVIDNNEYVMRGNQLMPREKANEDYALSNDTAILTPSTIDYETVQNTMSSQNIHEQKLILKKDDNTNQPIQILVSNEDEYKALMNANHSIIFEDGDANKTLTVLSTPQNQTIHDATLDLESAHSNDMMIIPQNYTMAVSSSLPTSSSNIVVVYSSSVNDQSQQYQLITQPNTDAQFVNSSAVIAPHFETITNAPDLNPEVINTEVEESWPTEFEPNSDSAQAGPASHVAMIEQTQIISAEDEETDLNNLPEVTLGSNGNIVESEQMSVTEIAIEKDDTENPSTEETSVIVDDSKVTDSSTVEEIIDETPISENIVEVNNPPIVDEIDTTEITANGNEVIETSEENLIEIQEHTIENTEGQSNNIMEEVISTEINNESLDPHPHDDIPLDEGEKQTDVCAPIEKVQMLASEWSDDEAIEETNNSEESIPKGNDVSQDAERPAELEESIENIQQEIDKDFSEQVIQGDTEEAGDDTNQKEDNLQVLEDTVRSMPRSIPEPQEKISSLLNDWEDNDSQENSVEIGKNENESEAVETPCDTVKTVTAEITLEQPNPEPIKDENLKKIVSDWDDEEEEQ